MKKKEAKSSHTETISQTEGMQDTQNISTLIRKFNLAIDSGSWADLHWWRRWGVLGLRVDELGKLLGGGQKVKEERGYDDIGWYCGLEHNS